MLRRMWSRRPDFVLVAIFAVLGAVIAVAVMQLTTGSEADGDDLDEVDIASDPTATLHPMELDSSPPEPSASTATPTRGPAPPVTAPLPTVLPPTASTIVVMGVVNPTSVPSPQVSPGVSSTPEPTIAQAESTAPQRTQSHPISATATSTPVLASPTTPTPTPSPIFTPTPALATTPVVINESLNAPDGPATVLNPGDGRAANGVYVIAQEFVNTSGQSFTDLYFDVVVLSPRANHVLNCDAGPGGVGCEVSVPPETLGRDGILSPGESFSFTFEIGLNSPGPIDFFVDVHGVPLP